MQHDTGFPEDFSTEIAQITRLAAALPRDTQTLDPETPSLPPDAASAAPLFTLMDYYESLSESSREHPEITTRVARALSNKKFRLADEKTIAQDDAQSSVLGRVINKYYPLPLIQAVLDRPEAKSLVRLEDPSAGNLIAILDRSHEPDVMPGVSQCFRAYVSHLDHPWQTLMLQTIKSQAFEKMFWLDEEILNLLIEKMGPFPWHDEASFLILEAGREITVTLPLYGIRLLLKWIDCENISLACIKKFMGDHAIEQVKFIEIVQLIHGKEFFIWKKILAKRLEANTYYVRDEDSEFRDRIKSFSRERIVFLLKARMTKVTARLLHDVRDKPDLFTECWSFLTPQELCDDLDNGAAILEYLIRINHPLPQIKALFPQDMKATSSLLNRRIKTEFRDDAVTILEILSASYADEDRIQFLLDHGSQVTGKAIQGNQDHPSFQIIMSHLRKAGNAWYQEPQQGYEILVAMITTQQSVAAIEYYLELESAHPDQSGVLHYVGADGSTFSNLLDYLKQYDYINVPALVKLLVKHGAIITGLALSYLLDKHPDLGMDLLLACDFQAILTKPPRHGAELISAVIEKHDNPIELLQPWLESKEEKAISAMLAHPGENSHPLSRFLHKRSTSQNPSNFILLLIRKGAIPSGEDLHCLPLYIREPVIVVTSSLNIHHLYAHSPEYVLDLLTAAIRLQWHCTDVEKLLDFTDVSVVTKMINHDGRSLLPIILDTWSDLCESHERVLQLIQLIIAKGYCLSVNDLENLKKIPLAHRPRIWTALAALPFKPLPELEFYSTSKIIFNLVDMQAPLERIQEILPSDHRYVPSLLVEIISSLNAENCAYRLMIILSLPSVPIDLDHPIIKILFHHHRTAQDVTYKNRIAAIVALIYPWEAPLQPSDLEHTLVEKSRSYFITAEYFAKANLLLKEYAASSWTAAPTVIIDLIWSYVRLPKLDKCLLDSVKDIATPFFMELLPVTHQSELGFCAAYAAFNAQLTSAIRRADPVHLQSFFSEDIEEDSKAHPRQALVKFFLDKAHEMKQGEEDGTPVNMRQLLKESLAKDITMLPFRDSETATTVGCSDFTLLLETFKNLLQLHGQFGRGKIITHSFVIYRNDTHWLAVSCVGKQSRPCLWLGMDSNPVSDRPSLERICEQLQKLMTEKEPLVALGQHILTQSTQELKPLLGEMRSTQDLLSCLNAIQALLEVYSALEKSPLRQLLDEAQRNQFNRIARLFKRFSSPEIASPFTACTEIIDKLQVSPFFAQPSPTELLVAPHAPTLLASLSTSSTAPSTSVESTPTLTS